jgi:hypothetical protein
MIDNDHEIGRLVPEPTMTVSGSMIFESAVQDCDYQEFSGDQEELKFQMSYEDVLQFEQDLLVNVPTMPHIPDTPIPDEIYIPTRRDMFHEGRMKMEKTSNDSERSLENLMMLDSKPMVHRSYYGDYYITWIDDLGTRMQYVYYAPDKSDQAVVLKRIVREEMLSSGKYPLPIQNVKEVSTDHDMIFLNQHVKEVCNLIGAKMNTSAPYVYEANRAVEQAIGAKMKFMQTTIARYYSPKDMRELAVDYVVNIRNRLVDSIDDDKMLCERAYGEESNLSHARLFDCPGWCFIDDDDEDGKDELRDRLASDPELSRKSTSTKELPIQTMEETCTLPKAEEWEKAYEKEKSDTMRRETWKGGWNPANVKLPPDKVAVASKYAFRVSWNQDRSLKYDWLVGIGLNQTYDSEEEYVQLKCSIILKLAGAKGDAISDGEMASNSKWRWRM